jgi:hypothetical protein
MIVVSMPSGIPTLPEINDLVGVTLKSLDSAEGEALASDVPSRIEDVNADEVSGRVEGYVIAAPRFAGDLDVPEVGSEFFLQWLSPRGVCLVPIAFEAQVTMPTGLQVWHVAVTGPPRREERRRFVRVPLNLPTRLEVRRNLSALPPQRRQRAEQGGMRAALSELPVAIDSQTINLSEGGLLCVSKGPVLPTHLPLISQFTVDTIAFSINSYVVWSAPGESGTHVESALTFDETDPQCEILRPLLFQAQLAARRSKLA